MPYGQIPVNPGASSYHYGMPREYPVVQERHREEKTGGRATTALLVIVGTLSVLCGSMTILGGILSTTAPVTRAPVTRAPMIEVPVVKAPVTKAPVIKDPVTKAPVTKAPAPETKVEPRSFKNCTALREVYPNGVPRGHSAYESRHDRDRDGRACERN